MVHTFRHGDHAHARLGITVSKRVGNAVIRNRVRRRLRELSRTRYAALPAGLELVITARASAATAEFAALETDFDRCLARGSRAPDE